MNVNAEELRVRLTHNMATAIDEADSFEAYFGGSVDNIDYGAARADGALPADMMFVWEFAGHITNYVASHGIDALDLVERVGNLFVAYQALKVGGSDFDESEKEKIKSAVVETLKELVNCKS
nr:hypothetical protein [uncultured Cohaesibacter sp.]